MNTTNITPNNATVIEFINSNVEDKEIKKKIGAICSNRLQSKKPITIEFIKLLLAKLEKYSNGDYDTKIEILNQSICRGDYTIYQLSPCALITVN